MPLFRILSFPAQIAKSFLICVSASSFALMSHPSSSVPPLKTLQWLLLCFRIKSKLSRKFASCSSPLPPFVPLHLNPCHTCTHTFLTFAFHCLSLYPECPCPFFSQQIFTEYLAETRHCSQCQRFSSEQNKVLTLMMFIF